MNRVQGTLRKIISVFSLVAILALAGLLSNQQRHVLAATPAIGNLILNPSIESSTTNWSKDKWGTNTAVFAYNATGHTGSHSVTTTLSKYKSGDAKWYPDSVAVTPSTAYVFSDWYQSNVVTEVDAVVTSTTGKVSYIWLANAPATSTWQQTKISYTVPADASKVTFYHAINKNGQLTVDDFDFESAVTPTPPPVTPPVTPPAPTPPPVTPPVTPPAPTPPTVQITSPSNSATLSGTQTLAVNAGDALGISNVKYLLDGNPLATVSTSPYSYSWDTKTTTNGSHTLSAIATNTSNLSTTSAAVTFNVNNVVIPPVTPPSGPNSIPNPSVETADATGTLPQDWRSDSWGTNTSAFSYLNTGHTGNHSLKVTVSSYSNGSANWDYTAQNVTSGHYRYTDWYQSDASTEIDAAVTINGVVQYYYLGSVLPSSTWAQAKAEFDIPAGATNITILHLIAAKGTLITDDFSFGPYVPAPFNRGIVSINFDDGWTNQFTNAFPLLNKYGQVATYYIISGELNDQPDYVNPSQINSLIASGNEIGSHSITHPDLTTLSTAQYQNEMQQSKITLQNTFGVPVTDFAYPFGAYNANTVAFGKTLYTSQRTVESGYNTKDNFNLAKVVVENVFNTTTPAQVKAWVDQANAQHTWLVLVYHEVAVTPTDPTDTQYDTQPSDLDAELNYIKTSGISVQTMQQAITELVPQL